MPLHYTTAPVVESATGRNADSTTNCRQYARRPPRDYDVNVDSMRPALLFVFASTLMIAQPQNAPKPQPLWPQGAPGALGTEDGDIPTLAAYLVPEGRGTGTAVVVCPGGGYAHLAMDHEGDQIARWLNSLGVQAFVLKYRLGPRYHHPIEL